MFQHYIEKYQSSYLWHAPFTTVYNVTRADDLQCLLTNSDALLRGKLYAFGRGFLGHGILISEGQKWQTSRKILGQYFHNSFYKASVEHLEFETNGLVQKLESYGNEKVNLQEELSQFVLRTFCRIILNGEFNTTSYLKNMKEVDRMFAERCGQFAMYLDFNYNFFGSGKKFKECCKVMRKLTSDMVQQRKENMNKEPKGILDHLLNSGLDKQTVCDEIDNLILAGYDTTSMTLSFILFQLSFDPDCQQKIYDEVMLQENVSNYANLEYLECVIKEGLRLFPGVPKIHRTVSRDIECGNLLIASNTEVSINIFDIHRDPKYYPNPESFEPERFLTKNIGGSNPYVHIPFSFGTRNCLGRKFALLEMKIVLSKILRNFRIVPYSKKENLKFKTGFLLRSCEDFYVKFVMRD